MEAKVRTIIVDDEQLARERLRTLLGGHNELQIVGESADGLSALELIRHEKPDLVFLDVQMPELDGFEVLEGLTEEDRPIVIFVTAHDQFALKAFDVHAIDYLLKPFDKERFERALKRGLEMVHAARKEGRAQRLTGVLDEARTQVKRLDRLMVKSDGRVLLLKVDDIDWIEAADNYVNIRTGNESHMMRDTMNSLESRLPPEKFMRISRSTIVNLERIKELQPMFHGEYVVLLKNGAKLTLSRGYRDKLDQLTGKG